MRHAVLIGVLTIWLGTMAALVFQPPGRVGDPSPDLEGSLTVGEPAQGWWGVYLQGRKVGFSHQSLQETASGIDFIQRSVLRMTTLGTQQTIRATAWGSLSHSLELRSARLALVTGASTLQIEVSVDGRGLVIETDPTEGGNVHEVSHEGPLFVPLGLRAALSRSPLQVGRSVQGLAFDPLSRSFKPLTLEVVGRETLASNPDISAWRVREEWRGTESTLWLGVDGELLREDGPMGLTAVAESREQAERLDNIDSSWDAVTAVSVKVDARVREPRTRKELRVHLSGVGRLDVPSGDGQEFEGDTLVVRVSDLGRTRTYELPYARGDRATELSETASMQVQDPRLRALALSILGPERDARQGAKLLLDWVHDYLAKVPIASVPDALETLDRGSGDCSEHAVLFTALARSAGLPARLAFGVVYGEDSFLYHAWSEVWLGRWVPVDPALGQFPVDATHIKLVEGGEESQGELIATIGKLGIQLADDGEGS